MEKPKEAFLETAGSTESSSRCTDSSSANNGLPSLPLGGKEGPLSPGGSSPGFSDLWEAWKETACCLHRLSRVAAYPSAAEILGAAFSLPAGAVPLVLPPHFAVADHSEYPKAKAAGAQCPAAFSRCFAPSVFCEFLRDAHGDVSTQTVSKTLLNSIFNAHLKEKVQPYLNDKGELSMESLSLMFCEWAEDPSFPALFALKQEDQLAHPGLLVFFARFLAVRLFFALDVGQRGFVRARDLLRFEEFQQLLNSLYKPCSHDPIVVILLRSPSLSKRSLGRGRRQQLKAVSRQMRASLRAEEAAEKTPAPEGVAG
ncbi:hypothetical protein cyc_02343 [Cyclospora cayetanensis]|uniref:Uncharacterized protein n=1 Tax=Cyclospora cayetanensis TaxID=88456 RepID=A0A1D3DAS7_9EIME|nr:hypothetical protein cyc_02343 [Cyclospora cayetanensis]